MPSAADKPKPSQAELAELSALADGTLDHGRREEVEARIAASQELRELYERERRVIQLLHGARAADRAPAALRARIESESPKARTLARRRLGYVGGLAGALAAAAVAAALVPPGVGSWPPAWEQAAAISLRGAAAPPPQPDASAPNAKLARSVDDVYFPNWTSRFRWPAVGQRTDRVAGQSAVTVYYAVGTGRIAYTIVAAPALPEPSAPVTTVGGLKLRTVRSGGRTIVTWRRRGDTCVLSARSLSAAELRQLAAWKVPGLET